MADVTLSAAGGEFGGHLATPGGAGPWPGVVLVHEAFGLTDDIRGIADRFAAHGYLALAPDFFAGGGSKLACVRTAFRELRAGEGRMFERLDGARAWLAGREDCSGRVGVAGFCLGGGFALLSAPRFESWAGDPTDHNPNTPALAAPLVGGPTIRLPGHHAKVRPVRRHGQHELGRNCPDAAGCSICARVGARSSQAGCSTRIGDAFATRHKAPGWR